ncbi:cytochrome P450 [Plantactinospora sp. ZYX-F-223]|uniref:cytochrome P450 n=1 Tax=Plantactinospora sp. ZYX-F-223 TaxID=3144103 RepID=UPI0031FBBDDE
MNSTEQQVRDYPFSTPTALDLDPIYAHLTEHEPVSRVHMPYGGDAWLATGYHEVKSVLTDPRFSRQAVIGADFPRTMPIRIEDAMLGIMDPPDHTRIRRLVATAFTARHIERVRPYVQDTVDELLDRMIKEGQPADLVRTVAEDLPMTVTCELLGIPPEDRNDQFRVWRDAILSIDAVPPEEVGAAMQSLMMSIIGMIGSRREQPTDDLVSALVRAHDDNDRLSEPELINIIATLLIGGMGSTFSQIANFAYTLLSRPELVDRLRTRPEILPRALEELQRYTPLGASVGFPHIAKEDLELGGVLIRAGEGVLLEVAAANRDPRVFDRPQDLDFTREPNPHLAFGFGMHHCVGAQLARIELQVTFETLLRRFPGLRLAVPAQDVAWRSGGLTRCPKSLPVAW